MRKMGIPWLSIVLSLCLWGQINALKPVYCGPSKKALANGTCDYLTDQDVVRGLHALVHPPTVPCKKLTVVQDIAVCEDHLDMQNCLIWSVVASQWCNHYGSIAFEKYWADRGCQVVLYHYTAYFKGNTCALPAGKVASHPNMTIVRADMWAGRCYTCWHKHTQSMPSQRVSVLKLQAREGVSEDLDGIQLTVMADLLQSQHIFEQIVWVLSMNTNVLTDSVGREAEQAWNMFSSSQFLSQYAAFATDPVPGPQALLPVQFADILDIAEVSLDYGLYRQSYLLIDGPNRRTGKADGSADGLSVPSADPSDRTGRAINPSSTAAAVVRWEPKPSPIMTAHAPAYCSVPPSAQAAMQQWIDEELLIRCHPTRLWVSCVRTRPYKAFIPCRQELMDNLAEDYAITKGWCDFTSPAAAIPSLGVDKVDKGAKEAFNRKPIARGQGVRLAFFFTVYTDAPFVTRLLTHLYSKEHYYLLHIDANNPTNGEFEQELRKLIQTFPAQNVFCAKDTKIVYGASTASMLLTKAMKWFVTHTSGWDYFIPVTGSDYPLVPLHRMEKIFSYQNPPMPFVMAWTPGTSTHLFRLQKTHPVFEENKLIAKSIAAVTAERGAVLGAVPMEYRSNNFGPPLFCSTGSSFYHLDNRVNKSSSNRFDTQWLFPRDIFKGRGRAYGDENQAFATPSFDGVWRVWKKSDPATTGAYDRLSVEYITESIEGRKYWHYFKHMLLGSEEHYYVSLLYNWPRTRAFVQTLSAQTVWNTWELGIWEMSGGFQTHTHFLTMEEWDILQGFSLRGMLFARKFSTKKTLPLLDRIDREILQPNSSSEAGLYWPGFYEVDTTTPGKQWVANYRKQLALRRKQGKTKSPMGRTAGNVSVSRVSTEEQDGRKKLVA